MSAGGAKAKASAPMHGRDWLSVALALAVVAGVYLHRLDRPLLWADEAQTGIGARNVLRFGYPTAFDGRNAAVIDSGRTLDESLTFKQIPWLSFYVGAASLALFGDDTAGLRTLFALIGALAVFPLYSVLKPRVRLPGLVTTLVLLSPQVVLFQRNARYYPLLIFLFAALLWHATTGIKSRAVRVALAVALFVLLFHTHVAVALGCGAAVVLSCGLRRQSRSRLPEYAIAIGAGLLTWIVWYQRLGPPLGPATTQLSLLPGHLAQWLGLFATGALATLLDFDAVGALPLLLWTGVLAWLLLGRRRTLRDLGRDPLVLFILIGVGVQGVASAAVFGAETGEQHSLLRYHAHLVVALVLLGFVVLDAAIASRAGFLLLCAAWIGGNLLTLSFWVQPAGRDVPASWLPPVCTEVFAPRSEAWDAVLEQLRAAEGAAGDRDQVLLAMPPWTQEVAVFYLGDRYLVPPLFAPEAQGAEAALRRALGEPAYARLAAPPTWIVDSLELYSAAPEGYDIAAVRPSPRARPDDGTRPELTRHAFAQDHDVGSVKLFRRRD